MAEIDKHIASIARAVDEWLQPDNRDLMQAIDRTVDEGLFALHDIQHQIRHLKQSVHLKSLNSWAERAGLSQSNEADKVVLCLHAGNLPLVGFQDLLAVIMVGGKYLGKISRKDPWLMQSFLKVAEKRGLTGKGRWSTKLDSLSGETADAFIFAGSEQTVPEVTERLTELKLIKPETPSLIRMAHFSLAWITDNAPETMENLAEAVFRYGGNGCRSVAVVVAPFHLDSQKCSFTDYVEAFWLRNPQHEKPQEKLFHRYAFNKAKETPQAWLNDFLIEQDGLVPDDKFVLIWVKGGESEINEIIRLSGDKLQSVYRSDGAGTEIAGRVTEPLSSAQKPPIWWKPDNTDTIHWLIDHVR
jgi:hypothetical protein